MFQWGVEASHKIIKLQDIKADYNTVLGFYLKTKYYGDAITQGWKMLKSAQTLKITWFSNN
jgi:hypothetical protein